MPAPRFFCGSGPPGWGLHGQAPGLEGERVAALGAVGLAREIKEKVEVVGVEVEAVADPEVTAVEAAVAVAVVVAVAGVGDQPRITI